MGFVYENYDWEDNHVPSDAGLMQVILLPEVYQTKKFPDFTNHFVDIFSLVDMLTK